MKVMMISTFWIIIFFPTVTLFSCLPTVTSQQPSDIYPTANLSTLWINNDSIFSPDLYWRDYSDNSRIAIILGSETTSGPAYACGFYSNCTRHSYLFDIFIIDTYDGEGFKAPQVVWSANRNNEVGDNSTLELTAEGDLVLKDGDGTLAWSTNTAGRSVARLNMTEMGNLVLLDANDSAVWQSFDHPTDFWLPGQTLKAGMNLTAGLYSVSVEGGYLVASIQSDHQQVYYKNDLISDDIIYTKSQEAIYYNTSRITNQYMKLGTDGHLRLGSGREAADVLGLSECAYPLVCGPYGICTNGQCSCPKGTSFRPINDRQLNLGCSEIVPLTCNASENHHLLDLDNVTYFNFEPDIVETNMNKCKEACLKNCSCKAAIFAYGLCYMPFQIFSLWVNDSVNPSSYNVSVSIKIQNAPTTRSLSMAVILGSTLGVLFVAVVIGVFVYRRKRRRFEEVEEDYLDHVPGMPTRFSLQELAVATDNFNEKLGEGGFGSVFGGSFNDGTRRLLGSEEVSVLLW